MTKTLVGQHFDQLSTANVILNARARRHSADVQSGPFSIKAVVEGQVSWRVANQHFSVEPGACLFLDKGETYSLDIDESQVVETFVIFFADEFISNIGAAWLLGVEQLLDNPDASAWLPITRRIWHKPTLLMRKLGELRSEISSDTIGGELDMQLRSILDCSADLISTVKTEKERLIVAKKSTRDELYRRLTVGKNILDDTYRDDFDLDSVATEACLSPHHFHRSFKQAFETTPFEYVSGLRFQKAKHLLVNSDMPLVDICTEINFSSLPTFVRNFKKYVGLTPGEYRRKNSKLG